MDLFGSYDRTDLAEVCPSFPNLNDDDDHFVLDMDSLVTLKTNALTTRSYEPSRKKCYFGDETNEIDGTGWSDKPIRNWCQEETINWLMSAASYIGQPYSLIQHSLAVPGNELVTFTKNDFINHDPMYGERLYDLLHSQHISNILPSFDTIHPHSEDEYARINSNNTSDTESDNNSIDVSTTKRPPGRPRMLKPKKNSTGQGKLWEFIRDLLRNRETCPSLICWEDYSQAKFRFVKSDEVAKRWGSRKGNTKMTYEKLSRAMRYYYKSKIFQPVLGRRLVYQFGPNAKGWQTDNPNFRY
ncbi:ETS-related transcription factor Elf-5-like isoform X1 [Frieseomelitta varia]|uniref:ETS-related transcription factor Elf-5-like isoform X1 n=2 Tax=Frieseomelitta varia TaxID=561572 RepID=UPI001CB6ABE4|nr:ETS-related transcription factor Elf-5-like isoform X1 [Frieseomelitta varia]